MNARCAPKRVIHTHFSNKFAYLCRYFWPPSKARAFRFPKQAEPSPVPADHGIWHYDQHVHERTWIDLIDHRKEEAVPGR